MQSINIYIYTYIYIYTECSIHWINFKNDKFLRKVIKKKFLMFFDKHNNVCEFFIFAILFKKQK